MHTTQTTKVNWLLPLQGDNLNDNGFPQEKSSTQTRPRHFERGIAFFFTVPARVHTQTIHGIGIFIYMNGWFFMGFHVGKYTNPMDAMG